MAIPIVPIAPSQPYNLHIDFDGIATYNVLEYARAASGNGWTLSKAIQTAGHSTDPQHDKYALSPIASGEQRLVLVSANMSSVTGAAPVSMATHFNQSGAPVHSDKASGEDSGALVTLTIRTIFEGK